jgi:hypothetical protein|tara:strand:- start:177 stop:341 length:165 start_codon:yes stop_codon:yes gene_type:complete
MVYQQEKIKVCEPLTRKGEQNFSKIFFYYAFDEKKIIVLLTFLGVITTSCGGYL